MAPLPLGVVGGITRAKHTWRYNDGTFMSHDNEEQIRIEQRGWMAPDGQAWAHGARRAISLSPFSPWANRCATQRTAVVVLICLALLI